MRLRKIFLFLLIGVVSFSLSLETLKGQGVDGRKVVVGTKEAPPFSIKMPDGRWSGISIELWEAIARRLNLSYEIRELDLQQLLDGVRDGTVDVGIAALTITSEREGQIDFTHSFYSTGLGIAVPSRGKRDVGGVVLRIFSGEFLKVLGLLTLLLLILGFVIWLLERKRNPNQFEGGMARGVFSGFWWAVVTMTTVGYGDKAPVTVGGRILAIAWMFIGIVLISTFIAALSSALTVTQLESAVRGPEDLPAVRVGAIRNSTGQDYLNERVIDSESYDTPLAAIQALVQGKVDAVIYDRPILLYLANKKMRQQVQVLPKTFDHQSYGIALPAGSDLREPINRVLLDEISKTEWTELLDRYLGKGN